MGIHEELLQAIEEAIQELNQRSGSNENTEGIEDIIQMLNEENPDILGMLDADIPNVQERQHHEDVVHSLYQWHNNKKYRRTDVNKRHRLPDDYPHSEYVKAYKRRKA